ncbi:MAG: hypothetical protein A2W05_06555 [Candidatus Schekmanbacteria bacterium RBG_16_38_10]|uniref:ASPIC/UnbV domain-containing protein n=1 Tax=Candidatus Schekmanbacteria bacterium RBG_16_38_10 TaxID=1817879 RepID=A0A1F7RVI4_9BACT|nr:MAG: hypothetical protein A2W05_06555 [Candidatus Schekmanbacteria bacterium RBG_16_38_10]
MKQFVLLIAIVFFSTIMKLPAGGTEMRFVDKTAESVLSYQSSPSWGLSWGDFNNDDLIDVYIKNHQVNPPSLYKNVGNGVFQDITSQTGFSMIEDFHGASWGDFDNDGDSDLYQANGACGGNCSKNNHLFMNNGDGGFTDIAGSAGVLDPNGRGRMPLWFDYNGDGYLDIFVANEKHYNAPSLLFKNEGNGTFTDVSVSAGVGSIEMANGAYLSDLNGDNKADLIISNWKGIQIFSNNGDGTFTDNGLIRIDNVQDVAIGDYDNDKGMDIFVSRGLSDGDAYEVSSSKLKYRIEVENIEKGIDFETVNFSVAEFDFYRHENRISATDNIYIGPNKYNPAQIPFLLDASAIQNRGEPVRSGPGCYIWFDGSDNKWHTRFVGLIGENFNISGVISTSGAIGQTITLNLNIGQDMVNKLFQNDGSGHFVDVTDMSGLETYNGNSMSAVFADFDNDGDLDIYAVYAGGISNAPNKLFENDGNGHFTDAAFESGSQASAQGRGESVAVADYNNDGFLDMIVLNGLGDAPFHLGERVVLENQKTRNNWLQIKLAGTVSNKDGVGAIVVVDADTLSIAREQMGGMHHFSQNSQVLQFGLGSKSVVDRITIYWPSGIVQQLVNVNVNQRLKVEEPEISFVLTPDAAVLPRGGVLTVRANIVNYSDQRTGFYFATNLILPDGTIFPKIPSALVGPDWISLAPKEAITRTLTRQISGVAPLGNYIYNGFIVKKPYTSILNENHFLFKVTPAP